MSQAIPAIPLTELMGCETCGMATHRTTTGECPICTSISTFYPMQILERSGDQKRLLELHSLIDNAMLSK